MVTGGPDTVEMPPSARPVGPGGLVASETGGGDTWFNYDTHLVTTSAAASLGSVSSLAASPSSWNAGGGPGNGFGPANLLYTAGLLL